MCALISLMAERLGACLFSIFRSPRTQTPDVLKRKWPALRLAAKTLDGNRRVARQPPRHYPAVDFIVGSPGETEAEFQTPSELARRGTVDRVGCFPIRRIVRWARSNAHCR